MIRTCFVIFALLIANQAQARVFNMNNESFAAYLRSTFGPAVVNTLNSKSNGGSTITLDSKHAYNFSGEFGFVYSTKFLNIRFGLELVKPSDIKDAVGKSSTDSEYYTMTSEISAIIPKVVFEFNVWQKNNSRVSLLTGVGYASLVARNSYSMTAAGTAALGTSEFFEDLRSSAMAYEGGVAYERLFSDTTTFVLDLGFRSLMFSEIKHNRDTTTFQGAVAKNDIATNTDGSNRQLNLSNYYGGISLRFWIH